MAKEEASGCSSEGFRRDCDVVGTRNAAGVAALGVGKCHVRSVLSKRGRGEHLWACELTLPKLPECSRQVPHVAKISASGLTRRTQPEGYRMSGNRLFTVTCAHSRHDPFNSRPKRNGSCRKTGLRVRCADGRFPVLEGRRFHLLLYLEMDFPPRASPLSSH
jgi:hypothetical protein